MITIRREGPEDVGAVRRINELAFERMVEADIVDALRGVAQPQLSLVAEYAGGVVGHIFFSPVTIRSGDSVFDAIGLAPMASCPSSSGGGSAPSWCGWASMSAGVWGTPWWSSSGTRISIPGSGSHPRARRGSITPGRSRTRRSWSWSCPRERWLA